MAYLHEFILCIDKCMKSLASEINRLNDTLKVFDRNNMPPLYKENNSVYTLDETFADWTEDNFTNKFSKFIQEMIKVKK